MYLVDGLGNLDGTPVFTVNRTFTLRHVQSVFPKVHKAVVHTANGTYVAAPGESNIKVDDIGVLSHSI